MFAEALAPGPDSVRHDDTPPTGMSLTQRRKWGAARLNAQLVHDALNPPDEEP
jgi:hypothetical protein